MLDLVTRGAAVFMVLVVVVFITVRLLSFLGWRRMDQPFNAYDIRTWPFGFAVLDAALFTIIWTMLHSILLGRGYDVWPIVGAALFTTPLAVRLGHAFGLTTER